MLPHHATKYCIRFLTFTRRFIHIKNVVVALYVLPVRLLVSRLCKSNCSRELNISGRNGKKCVFPYDMWRSIQICVFWMYFTLHHNTCSSCICWMLCFDQSVVSQLYFRVWEHIYTFMIYVFHEIRHPTLWNCFSIAPHWSWKEALRCKHSPTVLL